MGGRSPGSSKQPKSWLRHALIGSRQLTWYSISMDNCLNYCHSSCSWSNDTHVLKGSIQGCGNDHFTGVSGAKQSILPKKVHLTPEPQGARKVPSSVLLPSWCIQPHHTFLAPSNQEYFHWVCHMHAEWKTFYCSWLIQRNRQYYPKIWGPLTLPQEVSGWNNMDQTVQILTMMDFSCLLLI